MRILERYWFLMESIASWWMCMRMLLGKAVEVWRMVSKRNIFLGVIGWGNRLC